MKAKRIDPCGEDPAQLDKIEPQLHHTHDLAVAHEEAAHEVVIQQYGSEKVATQGGAYVGRDVNTAGGMFVGRDYVVTAAVAPVDLVVVRARYLEWIIAQYQYWDVSGLPLFNRLPPLLLEEIYLPLTIEPLKLAKTPAKRPAKPSDQPPIILTRHVRNTPKFGGLPQPGPQPNESQVWKQERLVLLGPPGAGKTTLLRFLTLQFAKTMYQITVQREQPITDVNTAPTVVDRDGNVYGEARLPIFVRLDQFAVAVTQEPALSLRAFLVQQHNDVGLTEDEIAALFQHTLEQGSALLFFDGLDTIQDASVRRAIAQRVEQFVSGAPGNHVILASRTQLYRSIAGFGSFFHILLTPMTQVEMTSLLERQKRALQSANGQTINRAGKPDHAILAQLQRWLAHPSLHQLATNPLMVTLMTLMEAAGERLPERRFAFYELAVRTLLERWEEGRGSTGAQQIKEHELLRLLGPLAYWIHTHKPTGIVSEAEVKSVLTVAFAGWLERSVESREIADAVESFFQRLCLQEGIFIEQAPQRYRFAYRAFQEYLVAYELVRRSLHGIQHIHRHRQQPQWQEPILLAVANLSRNLPLEAGERIRLALYKGC